MVKSEQEKGVGVMEYLKMLVEEFHSTTVATLGEDGHPQTRVIDMMHYEKMEFIFDRPRKSILSTDDGTKVYCGVCNKG